MSKLLDKFRGSLLGALAGDCLGLYFEGFSLSPIPINRVKESMTKDEKAVYSDDTAMTRALCHSIIEKQGFDDAHIANEFCNEYFREPNRGYGEGVLTVFRKLRSGRYEDFKAPAREQFGGSGSYGNGGAMRIAPIALFSKDSKSLIEYARRSTLITHTHANGVNGAILQAQAIFDALAIEPPNIDVNKYIDGLANVARELEDFSKKQGECPEETIFPYETKIREIKTLLSQPRDSITQEKVVEVFGNGIRAEQAVPAAIFAFLFKGTESVEEGIAFAISLGGDTDTIASMTGAIAGAYLGIDSISTSCRERCEASMETIEFAEKIYELRQTLLGN